MYDPTVKDITICIFRKDVLIDLCCNEEARISLIEALLKEGSDESTTDSNLQLHCACGQPRSALPSDG